eukprot:CAMPEP_0180040744 /NCGR_PEP_ID=MMETSP0984-20121128/33660_1 /TAXON_ID=483367 /ORGANISM="non described non described, Strain CCMP 2436" /LENGTH=36 /DNA_ID= /DNA_START= /DNA_END= /DNA_ORIENTATION=
MYAASESGGSEEFGGSTAYAVLGDDDLTDLLRQAIV